jgi:hypothetical protein
MLTTTDTAKPVQSITTTVFTDTPESKIYYSKENM